MMFLRAGKAWRPGIHLPSLEDQTTSHPTFETSHKKELPSAMSSEDDDEKLVTKPFKFVTGEQYFP